MDKNTVLLSNEEKILDNSEVEIFYKDNCRIYHARNKTGDGTISIYDILPGISFSYNRINMEYSSEIQPKSTNLLEIDYCKKGRFECEFTDRSCIYLSEGDLAVHVVANTPKCSYFPLGYYSGLSISIDLGRTAVENNVLLSDLGIDLLKLQEKLCPFNRCFVQRTGAAANHVFDEIFSAPHQIRVPYIKLKVVEIILLLSTVYDISHGEKRARYPMADVATIKSIKTYITDHPEKHFTQKALSKRFDIPLTTMKLCFKGVYGSSVYSFIRSYKMQFAANLLLRSRESVTDIAGKVGYKNPSKFSEAFKAILGYTPRQYRKKFVQTE